MFEFSKEEQEKLHQARKQFNELKGDKEKDKSKKMFNKLLKMGKKKSSQGQLNSNASFTSGDNHTQNSEV